MDEAGDVSLLESMTPGAPNRESPPEMVGSMLNQNRSTNKKQPSIE